VNENWYIFCIAIFKNITVEQAFNVWEGLNPKNNSIVAADVADMREMRKTMTYKAIGEIYGITDGAVFRRLKDYKRKNRSTAMETVAS